MNDRGATEYVPRLTLVVPVYREHLRLGETLRNVVTFLNGTPGSDAVFVDDGSPAESAASIRSQIDALSDARVRLIRCEKNGGKGAAVKLGVAAASGDLILMSDADLSTPLEDWSRLESALRDGADVACGSRAVPGARIGQPPPLHRRLLSRVFNVLVRLCGVSGIRDTQCGFKLFRSDVAKRAFAALRTRRFAFDVELIAWARDNGYRVVEVPVNWNYSGHSTVRLFSSGSRMVFDLFKLAVRRLLSGRF
jgi:dolichyl-phosphate beta-glucosyltransferase